MTLRPDAEPLARRLFFVVGAARSGTTLVQAMLSCHPAMVVPPETNFFDHDYRRAANHARWLRGYLASQPFLDQQLDPAPLAACADRRCLFLAILRAHAERTGRPHPGEKTPQHYKHVPEIAAMFPDARFIHVVRDGRDVVASRVDAAFARGSHLAHARSWRRAADVHLACLRAMPPHRYTELRYEQLVIDPEPELRRLCDFLGEPFDPAMLSPHTRRDAGFTQREAEWKSGTLRPITTSSIGRWRERLSPRAAAGVERVAGRQLTALRYPLETRDRLWWRIADAVRPVATRTTT